MIRISIIGSGNIAHHLITAIQKSPRYGIDLELVQVFSRNSNNAVTRLVTSNQIICQYKDFLPADIYIIAVSDTAIQAVSEALPFKNQLVVHTSGSSAIDILDSKNRKGVFYPLQTFSKAKPVDFSTVPICLEAASLSDYNTLHQLAALLSQSVYAVNSEQRKGLHVSAVFVSNFVNHLYRIGNDICDQHQLSFDILKPLIQETAQKIMTLSPEQAQTGPAKRKDSLTINTHLQFLTDITQKEIYTLLTKSIIDHEQKL